MTCRIVCAVVLLSLSNGCGRGSTPRPGDSLRVEILDDTSGISRGVALLTEFDVHRDPTGAIRARGRVGFPDGTRMQLSLYAAGTRTPAARTQFVVQDGGFESPPLGVGESLPGGSYRVELVTHFDSSWQSETVLRATNHGRALRGPGIVRGNGRVPAFVHTEDQRL